MEKMQFLFAAFVLLFAAAVIFMYEGSGRAGVVVNKGRACFNRYSIPFQLASSYPHDDTTFTQGLFVDPLNSSRLYESSGLRFRSRLQHTELETGRVLAAASIQPASLFAEGIAYRAFDDSIILLSWSAGRALTFNRTNLGYRDGHDIMYGDVEAWGLAALSWSQLESCTAALEPWLCPGSRSCLRREEEPACFLMSNGSNIITFRHPRTLEVIGSFPPLKHPCSGEALSRLNELEVVMRPTTDHREATPELWANIWFSDTIVVMNVCAGLTGQGDSLFVGQLNLSSLNAAVAAPGALPVHPPHPDAVLNGIAWDARTPRDLYVTGKWWRTLYRLQIGLQEHSAEPERSQPAPRGRALTLNIAALMLAASLVIIYLFRASVCGRCRRQPERATTHEATRSDVLTGDGAMMGATTTPHARKLART